MSEHTPEQIGFGTGPCGPFLDYQAHDDERPSGISDYHGREAIWLGGQVAEEDQQRIAMRYNAMSGISTAAPGSVAKLVEAANIIDAMPVDGCSPSVIESMLRQAKSLVYTALAAIKIEGGSDGK